MVERYDAIVIGTGQSGPSLADRLAEEGMRTAVLERERFGGTCVNVGCTPTKALVASARAAHMARRAAEFGVTLDGQVSVDMKRVKARKDEIVRPSTEGIENWLEGTPNVTIYKGHGRFEGARTVRVNDELLEADRIFLNVGTQALIPEMPGLEEIDYLTNSSMMEVDFLPEHLIIIGGSYIGLEFAQIYRRFGSQVTVVDRGERLIKRDDEDVSEAIRKVLEREGVNVRLNAECISFAKQDDAIAAGVLCKEGPPEVVGSHVLLAVGRVPNTAELGLEKAGVEVDDRGYVRVDEELRTNVPGIWALGDCNGRGAFTHTSYNDYEIVAANLLDDDPRRASERSETDGFIKILVDADSKEILGAAILGIGGDEVVHTLLTAMYAKLPYAVVSRAVHIHPTVAELIPTVLQDLEPLE